MGNHTAAGQMAGYLFQVERALYWLARHESRNAKVSIEKSDDVAVDSFDTAVAPDVLESAKHTISKKKTFGDTSEDLWKSLYIWLKKVNDEGLELDQTILVMVTNIELDGCLATRLGTEQKSVAETTKLRQELRTTSKNVPAALTKYATYLAAQNDIVLDSLIKSLRMIDNSQPSNGLELQEKISTLLHIPSDLPHQEIVEELLGWVYSTTLSLWRARKPAIIERDSLDKRFTIAISRHRTKAFRETAKALISITNEQRNDLGDMTFVKQISIVSDSELEQQLLLEAMDDYLCFRNEIVKLATEGNITGSDIDSFKQRLRTRWGNIFRQSCLDVATLPEDGLAKVGLKVLLTTIEHRESLAGHMTEEYYLTSGCYHSLADGLEVGWHPEYRTRLKSQA